MLSFQEYEKRFYESGSGSGLSDFVKLLQSGTVKSIHFYGDGMTEGVGADGHVTPPPNTRPVIYDSGGVKFYEAKSDTNSWVNLFRRYIAKEYLGNISVINKGINGKSAKWANANKSALITGGDIAFIMFGINDRTELANATIEYRRTIKELVEFAKTKYTRVIVMSEPPAFNDYDAMGEVNFALNFATKDMDKVLTELCMTEGYTHISHYREMIRYSVESGVPAQFLTEITGWYPLEKGHYQMWTTMQSKLGFADSILDIKNNSLVGIEPKVNTVKFDTPATAFVVGQTHVSEINYQHPDIAKFPTPSGGILTTYRAINEVGASYQIYKASSNDNFYTRDWLNIGAWGNFIPMNNTTQVEEVVINVGNVNANSTITSSVNLKHTINEKDVIMLTLRSFLPYGIYAEIVRQTVTQVAIRFTNLTNGNMNVGAIQANIVLILANS